MPEVECRKADGHAQGCRVSGEDGVRWVQHALHELCQPLMALDCLLYVSLESCDADSERAPEVAAMRRALQEASMQSGRIIEVVRAMQERLSRQDE